MRRKFTKKKGLGKKLDMKLIETNKIKRATLFLGIVIVTILLTTFILLFFNPLIEVNKLNGKSMEPTIKDGDLVYIYKSQDVGMKNIVAYGDNKYKWYSSDLNSFFGKKSEYIIHRITGICANGDFLIEGDNEILRMKECVNKSRIMGEVIYYKNG